MKSKPIRNLELLRKQFDYDAENGRLVLVYHPSKNQQWRVGQVAGTQHSEGGWAVRYNGGLFLNARLVWAYHYGDPGDQEIDHIDGDRSNDKIDNLRLATRCENERNKGTTRRNTSGHKGVSWYKRLGKWRVDVCGKTIGYFADLDEAIKVRIETATQLCGEFAK